MVERLSSDDFSVNPKFRGDVPMSILSTEVKILAVNVTATIIVRVATLCLAIGEDFQHGIIAGAVILIAEPLQPSLRRFLVHRGHFSFWKIRV